MANPYDVYFGSADLQFYWGFGKLRTPEERARFTAEGLQQMNKGLRAALQATRDDVQALRADIKALRAVVEHTAPLKASINRNFAG